MDDRSDADRAGRAFRTGLRAELPRWRAEGLVDERVERLLVGRYRLEERDPNFATAAVFLLGALLVGGGVISFVAWNWADIGDGLKLLVIGGAMVAAHLVGYRTWRVTKTWPRLGHALVVLGTLIYGADIGLVAQIYHVHAKWYGGLAAWATGAAVAAWCLRSVPNAALGAIVATIWGVGWAGDHAKGFPLAPWAIGAVFLPFAWITRSRWVFGLTAAGIWITSGAAAGEETSMGAAVFATVVSVVVAQLAWPFAFETTAAGSRLAVVSRALGFVGFGILAYGASFEHAAHELSFEAPPWKTVGTGDFRGHFLFVAAPMLAAATAFLVVGRRRVKDGFAGAGAPSATVAALIGAALLLVCLSAPRDTWWVPVAGNVALALPAAAAIAASVRVLDRGPFWLGTLTLAALVVTRFFEFDTNLGVKAAAFIGAGVAVILFGVLFERRLRARGTVA